MFHKHDLAADMVRQGLVDVVLPHADLDHLANADRDLALRLLQRYQELQLLEQQAMADRVGVWKERRRVTAASIASAAAAAAAATATAAAATAAAAAVGAASSAASTVSDVAAGTARVASTVVRVGSARVGRRVQSWWGNRDKRDKDLSEKSRE